jgi:hypothetical protein
MTHTGRRVLRAVSKLIERAERNMIDLTINEANLAGGGSRITFEAHPKKAKRSPPATSNLTDQVLSAVAQPAAWDASLEGYNGT